LGVNVQRELNVLNRDSMEICDDLYAVSVCPVEDDLGVSFIVHEMTSIVTSDSITIVAMIDAVITT
jgi:hypothetical protein